MTATSNSVGPYADTATNYWKAGWVGILPADGKKLIPTGRTGREGIDPTRADIEGYVEEYGNGNIVLRMPPGMIGIDVDQYDAKQGNVTLAKAVEKWGPLPPTWSSTSRPDRTSSIQFFQVPEGVEFRSSIELDGTADIEIIQRHHRYSVVAPSIHPHTGNVYQWYQPGGDPTVRIPKPGDMAELPTRWVEGLAVQRPQLERHDPVTVLPQRADRAGT